MRPASSSCETYLPAYAEVRWARGGLRFMAVGRGMPGPSSVRSTTLSFLRRQSSKEEDKGGSSSVEDHHV